MSATNSVERPVGRLRWKLEPRETGLRAVAAEPRSAWLSDGSTRYACVSSHGRSSVQWFWVAGWDSKIPHKNTAMETPLSLDDAKEAAMAYVRDHMKIPYAASKVPAAPADGRP